MAKALAWTALAFAAFWFLWTVFLGAEIYPSGRDDRAEIFHHDVARQRMAIAKANALAERVEWELRFLEWNAEDPP